MKLPNSKIYWADFLSYSAILSDKEVCQVLRLIAIRAMSYKNPQDNLQDNPQDLKQKQIQIQKLNQIQLDFYKCLEKAQDESAKDYIASVTNGKKGGRPKNQKNQNEQTETKNINIKQKLKTEDIIDFESLFDYWEQHKKGGRYKTIESRIRMANKLKELTNNDFEYAKKAIFYAIDNNYQGFTDGSKLYYREKPTQKSLYEKCVENGLKFLEDTND